MVVVTDLAPVHRRRRCLCDVLLPIVVVAMRVVLVSPGEGVWTYTPGKLGPEKWCPDVSEDCCGKKQSPIDITGGNVETSSVEPLEFGQYDVSPDSIKMENNGRSVSFSLEEDEVQPTVSGAGLNATYNFHSFHFHWGANSTCGSEHTFFGRNFPLEMHIVHYNSKFKDLVGAIKSEEYDALVVLGIMFCLDPTGAVDLQPVLEHLKDVCYTGEEYVLKEGSTFPLEKLLPDNPHPFYRYSGSLTTPKCGEVAVWIIFHWSKPISEKQLCAFRRLHSTARGEKPRLRITDNYRKVMPLNDRTVHEMMSSTG